LNQDKSNDTPAASTEQGARSTKTQPPAPSPQPWPTFLLPFLVYMLLGSFEPPVPPPLTAVQQAAPAHIREQLEAGPPNFLGLRYQHYPIIYTVKIALTIAAMLSVLPGYREFPFHVSLMAIAVGIVGILLWIWLCKLHLEPKLLAPLGLDWLVHFGDRPAFNPLEQLKSTPAWAWTFLAIRFVGLALVVPVIEEFFLRGFLMRFVQDDSKWWQVPFGKVTPLAAVVGTAVPMLMHPAELLAACVWFSLVTWLMVRTKNIWDCVAAHAVTNFLLGLYVVTQHQWQLW
jgi:CAAX protease family protein